MSDRPARRRDAPPPHVPRRPPEQLSLLDESESRSRPTRTSGNHAAIRKPRGPRFGEQFEFFPPKVTVERLDPHRYLGIRSRVAGLWRVTIGNEDPHLVFEDRHGRYCETHGVDCRAVRLVREAD